MGNCSSDDQGGSGAKDARKAHQEIEKRLKEGHREIREQVKLLLLGPGESGKSTIFKQMKILARPGGYTEAELMALRPIVYSNCLKEMQVLSKYALESDKDFDSEENKQRAVRMEDLSVDDWSPHVATDIKALWEDSRIQSTYARRNVDFQLNDSASYFFNNVDRFMDENYVPDEQDALRARLRSTGIEEAEFKFDELKFRLLDVGGQRSERRKWLNFFEGVTAVLFCASLSEYDQVLREDGETNRMKDSLALFDDICNSPWFTKTAMILFLNKRDLFLEKIGRVDLNVCFDDYEGGCNPEPALAYIKGQFSAVHGDSSSPQLYVHCTCAISTENVDLVFRAVKETLLRDILHNLF